MPKLLDFLKNKEISHAEAMELIEKHFVKPDAETEAPEVPDTEDEQIIKPDLETETPDAETEEKSEETEEEDVDIAKLVQEEVAKILKVKRKVPSKGKVRKTPTLDYKVNIRGYEEKTERPKK